MSEFYPYRVYLYTLIRVWMSYTLEQYRKKVSLIERFLTKFETIQGYEFCFGIREIAVDFREGELITGHLVLDTQTWFYETAASPQAIQEIVGHLEKHEESVTKKDLLTLARRVNNSQVRKERNIGYLSAQSYLSSREAALLLALCRHLTSCSHPGHCGWDLLLEGLK